MSQHFEISFRVSCKAVGRGIVAEFLSATGANIPLESGIAEEADHCPVEGVVEGFLVVVAAPHRLASAGFRPAERTPPPRIPSALIHLVLREGFMSVSKGYQRSVGESWQLPRQTTLRLHRSFRHAQVFTAQSGAVEAANGALPAVSMEQVFFVRCRMVVMSNHNACVTSRRFQLAPAANPRQQEGI